MKLGLVQTWDNSTFDNVKIDFKFGVQFIVAHHSPPVISLNEWQV